MQHQSALEKKNTNTQTLYEHVMENYEVMIGVSTTEDTVVCVWRGDSHVDTTGLYWYGPGQPHLLGLISTSVSRLQPV